MTERTLVLDSKQIDQRIDRLAWQLYEHCYDQKDLIIAGIAESGFELANRICTILIKISGISVSLVKLEMDKDNPNGTVKIADGASPDLKGRTVVVIDDVSNSGRTLMYGVKFFLESEVYSVKTLVLVDRDHNRFPVKTDFVGLSLATTMQEHISVEFEGAGKDAVYLD